MTNRTPAIPTPKTTSKRDPALKLLDPDNPNDNAFKSVTAFVFCRDVKFSKKNSIFRPIFAIPPGRINH